MASRSNGCYCIGWWPLWLTDVAQNYRPVASCFTHLIHSCAVSASRSLLPGDEITGLPPLESEASFLGLTYCT